MHASPSDQPTTGRSGHVAPAGDHRQVDPDEPVDVTLLTRLVVAAVLTAGLGYLVWRTTTIGRGWILALSLPVLWAEIWSWVQLLLLRFQVVPKRRPVNAGSPIDRDEIDVVIVVGPESTATDLERTMVGLAVTGWQRTTTVLTGRVDPDLQTVVNRFDSMTALRLEVRIDDSTAVSPLPTMVDIGDGAWLLWLQAGQVPMPRLFEAIVGSPVEDGAAVRQLAVGLLNPSSLFHLTRGGDEEALERQVIGPALASRGVAPWRGPASLVRRTAVRELLNRAPSYRMVPEWAVALHRDGWSTDYDSRPLIRDLAPDMLQPYLVARRDRSAAALISLGAAFTQRGVTRTARWAAMAAGVSLTYGIRQLAVTLVLAAALLLGRLPFVGELSTVAAAMVGFAAANMTARHMLSGGMMSLGDWTRHGWRTLGADLAALVPTLSPLPDRRDRVRSQARLDALGHLQVLVVAFSFFEVAFAARAFNTVYPTLLPAMPRRYSTVLILVALVTTYILVDVLGVLVWRRQRRRAPRIPLEADIAVAGRRGTTLDVTPVGVGAVLDSAPALDETVPVRFSVPRADGAEHDVETTARVRAATRHESGLVRVGMEFEELSDEDRIALTEYCALGAHGAFEVGPDAAGRGSSHNSKPDGEWRVGESAMAHSHPEDLSTGFSRSDLNLLRLLAAVATVAAVIAVFLGPVAGPASAQPGEQGSATIPPILTVLVPTLDAESGDGAGSPDLFVAENDLRLRLYTDAWSDPLLGDGRGGFLRPDMLGPWSGEALVAVALGPDRHVGPIPDDATLVLSRLRIEPDAGLDRETVELVGPGGRWRTAVDGDILVPGRYTIRLTPAAGSTGPWVGAGGPADSDPDPGDAFTIERIEVGPGQLVTIDAGGVTVSAIGEAVTPMTPADITTPADGSKVSQGGTESPDSVEGDEVDGNGVDGNGVDGNGVDGIEGDGAEGEGSTPGGGEAGDETPVGTDQDGDQ